MDEQRRPSLIGPVAATAGLAVPLVILDRRMQGTGGPGIIPFELAGPGRSEEILRVWGEDGRRAARASLLLDFPYLVAYTSLGARLTGRARDAFARAGRGRAASAASTVVAIQIVAGACDALENAALLGVVVRGGDASLASVARAAASVKFAGLVAGWLYGIAALVALRTSG